MATPSTAQIHPGALAYEDLPEWAHEILAINGKRLLVIQHEEATSS